MNCEYASRHYTIRMSLMANTDQCAMLEWHSCDQLEDKKPPARGFVLQSNGKKWLRKAGIVSDGFRAERHSNAGLF